MVEEKLREWVEEKLDEGIDPERIEQSLRETGHDPSIVEEVKSPFDGETDVSRENLFEDSGPENGENREADHESPGGDMSRMEETPGRKEKKGSSVQESGDEAESSGREVLSPPSLSPPSLPVTWKQVMVVVAVILVAGGSFYVYDNYGFSVPAVPDFSAPSFDTKNLPVLGKNPVDCDEIGVRIMSASVSEGVTTANVRIVGDTKVRLEVQESRELVGSTSKKVSGSDTLSVNTDGDRVILSSVRCPEESHSLVIG